MVLLGQQQTMSEKRTREIAVSSPSYMTAPCNKKLDITSIISWNVQGLSNLYINDLQDGFDVGCLYETWSERVRDGARPYQLRNYFNVWAPATRENLRGRASGGLLIVATNKLEAEIIEVTSWWCIIRIESVRIGMQLLDLFTLALRWTLKFR